MAEELVQNAAIILALGVGSQWVAWRLRLPSILLLLISGFLAGPVFGWVHPDELLGEWVMPVVSISVALILFEGGLTLKFRELKAIGDVVRNLITIGALVTWAVCAGAAYWILGWSLSMATLFGAVLVVTGPTVIMPLLRHVQPARQVGSTLKWEGILIDPIGALLALLVFEVVVSKDIQSAPALALAHFGKTILVSGVLGFLGTLILVILVKRYWAPDYLQNPISLMVVVGVFTVSNHLQSESGLLTVTLMGIALANHKGMPIRHIVEFKENLRVLLIAILFILLAARLDLEDVRRIDPVKSGLFLLVLFFVARPAAVFLSTGGSQLSYKERLFLAWMAPRGIVAAAVASIFALRLSELGHPDADQLVPLTFLVIVSTVAIYGLTSSPVARFLGVSKPNPQGTVIVGAHRVARAMGAALKAEGFSVLLVDTNRENILAARMEGLPTYYGSALGGHMIEETDMGGIGKLLAMTSNPEVNALACLHFIEYFGRSEVYQLGGPPEEKKEAMTPELQGRRLFGKNISYGELERRLAGGASIKKTNITGEFGFEDFQEFYGEKAILLFLVTESGGMRAFAADKQVRPQAGSAVISLVDPMPDGARPV